MIEAKLITDKDLILKTMTQPHNYEASSDDGCPDSASFDLPDIPSICYVGVYDEGEYLGLFALHRQNAVTFSIHTCLLKKAWNSRTDDCAKAILAWAWENTNAHRIITEIPSYNEAAFDFAKRNGFVFYGLNKEAWLKDEYLHDLILMGITRPETVN